MGVEGNVMRGRTWGRGVWGLCGIFGFVMGDGGGWRGDGDGCGE